MLDSHFLITDFHRNDIQSDHTYPHTSVLDEMADEKWIWINEGAVV